VIKYNHDLYEIIDFQLVKMQQRQAIVRTKLKSITNGNVLEQPFRSGERFEEVYLEDRPIQYLYSDGEKYHFMDSQSYLEVVLLAKTLGEQVNFLQENMEVTGRYSGDKF
jgi:elongation factor P